MGARGLQPDLSDFDLIRNTSALLYIMLIGSLGTVIESEPYPCTRFTTDPIEIESLLYTIIQIHL